MHVHLLALDFQQQERSSTVHMLSQGSPSVMFVNVPLAKENHMVKFRFKVGQGEKQTLPS